MFFISVKVISDHFSISPPILKAMKTCEVDLSESDVTRLALRFDEEESMRIDIQKFLKFIRGVTDGWTDRQTNR